MTLTPEQLDRLLASEDEEGERVAELSGVCRELVGLLREAQGKLAEAATRAIPAPVVNVATPAPHVNVAAPKIDLPPLPPAVATPAKPCGWTCSVVKRDRDGRAEMFRFEPMQ